jgi:hypothetical protein
MISNGWYIFDLMVIYGDLAMDQYLLVAFLRG